MKLTPSSTARRRTRIHSSRSAGGPQTPGPVIRMAPNPRRLTVRSPPKVNVPDACATEDVLTEKTVRPNPEADLVKLSDLDGLPLTYAEVGATNDLGVDDIGRTRGYRHTHLAARIGSGRARFEEAAAAVMRYGMLRGAGVQVTASTEVAEV